MRDLPVVCARGGDGATTVAATAHLAARAGIRVFATGGIGGVHRDARASFDESADLVALARTPICVVCAGVKSILDVGATLERLETLGVTVLGYRTDRFAGFYLSDSGHPVPWRVDSPGEIAAIMRARGATSARRARVLVANPLPATSSSTRRCTTASSTRRSLAAAEQGIHGKDDHAVPAGPASTRDTGGESLRANVALVLRNAALAGEIAVAAAARDDRRHRRPDGRRRRGATTRRWRTAATPPAARGCRAAARAATSRRGWRARARR